MGEPPPRGRAWRTGFIVLIAVILLGAGTVALLVRGSSQSSGAIARAKAVTETQIAEIRREAGDRGQTLEVHWGAVQDPGGSDAHEVTVRLELRPSGEETSASFVVRGTRVVPQDALARRLAASP